VVRGNLRPENWPVLPGWTVLGAPGLAVMLVAAASPPGVLWASEAGGYDVLSYHPSVWNPAFDVTPNDLVTGIITERGIARAPYVTSLPALFKSARPERAEGESNG
jgi:hypothetical protein